MTFQNNMNSMAIVFFGGATGVSETPSLSLSSCVEFLLDSQNLPLAVCIQCINFSAARFMSALFGFSSNAFPPFETCSLSSLQAHLFVSRSSGLGRPLTICCPSVIPQRPQKLGFIWYLGEYRVHFVISFGIVLSKPLY